MGSYAVTSGIVESAVKVVIYGPEGIGKSTFASKFPVPVFIDAEGGTKRLDVMRLPQPTSWAMLMDEVDSVRQRKTLCGTLVIDTADWAERLCIQSVCDKAKVHGIEDFGYGKGYTYAKEEFGRLLDLLQDVVNMEINVVVLAHAQITKFEQPDEMGQYDRWTMKTSKQVAPLLREWCDMLLFANYKTIVVKDGDGKAAKGKAQGGRRVMYTTHHPCWDAKNRFGLPDEMPFEYDGISQCITAGIAVPAYSAQTPKTAPTTITVPCQPVIQEKEEKTPDATAASEELNEELKDLKYPDDLRQLMVASNVSDEQLRTAVFQRGCYPFDMAVSNYDDEFTKRMVAVWGKWLEFIKENDKIPF
ncbi:MAG: ATP-binding protein [Clostridiales bacterium]|nr:ATP-binding protein [Clostridiales bacterium]